MKLSTRSRYGVRAIFDMAFHSRGKPVQIKDISDRQGISPRYLEQIFQKLKKAGLIQSIRGPRGGYYLTRPAEKIRVHEIINAIGEAMDPVFCCGSSSGRKRCKREGYCVARLIWQDVGRAILSALESITIAQMCKTAGELGLEHSNGSGGKSERAKI